MTLGLAMIVMAAAPARAEPREVTVRNGTDLTLMELRVSPAGQGAWSADTLGTGVIGPGATGVARIDGDPTACAVDLMAVFDDGRESVSAFDACIGGEASVRAP